MTIIIVSFSFRDNGTPKGAVWDCRKLRNPYNDTHLRPLNGTDPKVQEYVMADPKAFDFLASAINETRHGIPIAFGCTGGQHRSVTLAEILGGMLQTAHQPCTITHLNLKANEP